ALPVGLKVAGRTADPSPQDDGYVHLKRRWQAGDVVELNLPMPVRRVQAHEKVEADKGKVALMRGPIVYCVEAADHGGADVLKLSLPREAGLIAEHRPGLLGGVTVLSATGRDDRHRPVKLTAIPYYAWQNREAGPMAVWVKEQ
ncbi:MAG: glycoside hydrolase family 127 protein, partial [Phycisphaerae bacterium]